MTYKNDGSGMTFYMNGSQVGTTFAATGDIDTTFGGSKPVGIGGNLGFSPTIPIDAKIDEPAVWDKELTAAEITELYNGGTPFDLTQHSAASNLVSWWRMGDDPSDDATGTTGNIEDQIGTNNGVPQNTEGDEFVTDVP